MLEEAVKRVVEMEQCFDALLAAAETAPDSLQDETIHQQLQKMIDYYENGQWMADYLLDEAGQFPAGLKRGVLSEDGVYNLLTDLDIWLQAEQGEVYL